MISTDIGFNLKLDFVCTNKKKKEFVAFDFKHHFHTKIDCLSHFT